MNRSWTHRLTGRHVLIGLLSFFGVISAVNAVFVYLAIATHPGIDTPDAYRRGIAYNSVLNQAAAQETRGWRGRVDHDAQGRSLKFTVADRTGRRIDGLVVSVELRRPVHAGNDRRLDMVEDAPGRYRGTLPVLPAGQWMVRVTARDAGGRAFRIDRRVSIE